MVDQVLSSFVKQAEALAFNGNSNFFRPQNSLSRNNSSNPGHTFESRKQTLLLALKVLHEFKFAAHYYMKFLETLTKPQFLNSSDPEILLQSCQTIIRLLRVASG